MMKKLITKIEGEAYLKVYGEDIVEFVEIEFFNSRGIEKILKNRPFLDALVINPRICGICGHSHLLATAKVIEKAFNAKISRKAEILRSVTTAFEVVENHIKWFYITLFPTQIKDKSYFFKAIEYSSLISKAIAIIAGQFPHNSYIIPGGVTCDVTNLDIVRVKDIAKKVLDKMDEIFLDIEVFFERLPKDIGKSLNKFLVVKDTSKIEEKDGVIFYENNLYEVGPLARMINEKEVKSIYLKYEDSIYTRVFARIFEAKFKLIEILNLLEDIDLCEKSYIKPKVINSKASISIEAPRGSLIHSIEIEDKKIKNYHIIVPTQINLATSTKNNPSAAQAALIGEKKEYIDTIFKCFDICAVCVGH